ncbi:MAG: AMP-dependent synthetase and ligase [Pedosphaera sp.]|nr:AMP-dependent synthetase and ligase [Pedosphaera sp.]
MKHTVLVQDFLSGTAARLPDKVALICQGRRLTYAQIDDQSDRLAAALVKHGVKRGDRVAICLDNSAELVVSLFAILKAGGVFVIIDPASKRDKLVYMLHHSRTVALVCNDKSRLAGSSLLHDVPSLKFFISCGRLTNNLAIDAILNFDAIQSSFAPVRPPTSTIDLDPACLIYTSGTTGEPKAVVCDHSNMVFVAHSVIEYLHKVESDIVLNVLPLAFSYGLYQVLMTFQVGGTLVLENSFAFPAAILKQMESEKVTGFAGVPTIFGNLLRLDLSQYDLSRLRYLTNAAASLSPSHLLEIRARLPHVAFYSMYGQTETKRSLYLPPEQVAQRPDSVGIAIPGTEVWLEDAKGQRLGAGEVGELVVRGRHVMRGYWEAPAATAERFRPGPFPGERVCHTGDLFRMDAEGYFYFVARKDDIFKSLGRKVAPKQIEDVLCRLPGVVEAAVIGVPDQIMENRIKAFIVLGDVTLTEAQVIAHCRTHLEDYLVPKAVEFCPQLPKTDSGKIKKGGLL